jgi:uroporphyrinogen decarboxylase
MKSREIILKALEGGKPGRVPVALVGGGMWSVNYAGTNFEKLSRDSTVMSKMLIDLAPVIQSDIVYAGSGYPNFPVAALGGLIKFREIGTPDLESPIVHSADDLEALDISRIDSDPIIEILRESFNTVAARIGEEYAVTMTAWAPFTLAARLIGEEFMMKAVFKQQGLVEKCLEFSTKVLKRFYEPLMHDGKLEVILLGDPTASGDLISRKLFETFSLPHLKDFCGWAKSKGAHTIVHICGNTTDRLDLFANVGASCISLDHKVDIARAKEILRGKICIAGNVDPVNVLMRGTVHEVEKTCRKIMQDAAFDGGFILMPGCDIPPSVPYENIRAFVQAARQWA